MKDTIHNIFIEVDGNPESTASLANYIDFVLNNKYDGSEYAEIHHILDGNLKK